MAGAIVQAVGTPGPSSATSQSATIAASAAGNALINYSFILANTGPATITSSGSTWTPRYSDNLLNISSAQPGATSTTSILSSIGTASFQTMASMEVSGLKTGGNVYVSTSNLDAAGPDWVTNSISPTVPVFAMIFCAQATTSGVSSTFGAGWTPITGTGISSGYINNPYEGDSIVVAYGNFAAGSLSGSGTWASGTFPSYALIIAFEIVVPSIKPLTVNFGRPF